jgi:hypothetical protein
MSRTSRANPGAGCFSLIKMMKILRDWHLPMLILLMIIWLVACSPSVDAIPLATGFPDEAAPPLQKGQVRQWAMGAEASSEFADPEWAAAQATGAPDTPRCGDYQTAWATASSDTIGTLVLSYDVSVYVTGVNIVQSFNPNQITLVELVGVFDRAIVVFESQPIQVYQPCPYTLSIPIDKTEGLFNKVRITVNLSVLGLGWNQIDAVELIGDMD